MSVPLRVGVIGCGGIAQMMHLPTLFERPDLFRVAALADHSAPVLHAVAARWGVPGAALETDVGRLVAREDVDAVLLLASGSHVEPAIAALEAGKHLFTEKPLGFSLAECEQIAAAARRSGRVVMVGYHKRYDPAWRRARALVRAMDELRFVDVRVLHPDDAAYRTHHAVLLAEPHRGAPMPEEASRRVVASHVEGHAAAALADTLGPVAPLDRRIATYILFQSVAHQVNALRGLLGEPDEVVSASSWQGGFAQTSLSSFPGDLRASVTWVSLPGLKHYQETYLFASPRQRVTLVFPSPYLRHAPTRLLVERTDDADELVIEDRTVSYEEAFRAELHEFARCVREGAAPETDVDDAVADARWMTAIARAYR